jgi:hypothetical protein
LHYITAGNCDTLSIPLLTNGAWPATGCSTAQGFACKGVCNLGFTGHPTLVCEKEKNEREHDKEHGRKLHGDDKKKEDERKDKKTETWVWKANGKCTPASCGTPPAVLNATWNPVTTSTVGECAWLKREREQGACHLASGCSGNVHHAAAANMLNRLHAAPCVTTPTHSLLQAPSSRPSATAPTRSLT